MIMLLPLPLWPPVQISVEYRRLGNVLTVLMALFILEIKKKSANKFSMLWKNLLSFLTKFVSNT